MPQIARNIPQQILPLFKGATTEITLPSSRVVKIRETNGEDDEILSSWNDAADGSNIDNFLSAIIINDSVLGGKPTPEDISKWPINDKYALLFKQRVFIYGHELKFKAKCTEEKCGQEYIYTEDLSKWDNDLSKDSKKPISSIALRKYPMGLSPQVEFTIASGKKLRYSIVTGELEKKALELKDMTKNSPLIIRGLEIENKGEWIPVTHFAGFSSKEMLEIRSNVKENDLQFDPMVNWNCNNPLCKKEYSVPLFQIGTFFYPEEMI